MRCIVFESHNPEQFMAFVKSVRFQPGVEADIYVSDGNLKHHLHHHASAVDENTEFEEVGDVDLDSPAVYDRVYIVGADFGLRGLLVENGFDYKNISMCYGDIFLCRCPLDDVFIIPKAKPQVPFAKKPAEIYQHYEGETSRAHARRAHEGFFDKYCQGEGLDVGYGGDVITPTASGWDFRNGNAQYLSGIDAESFDYV